MNREAAVIPASVTPALRRRPRPSTSSTGAAPQTNNGGLPDASNYNTARQNNSGHHPSSSSTDTARQTNGALPNASTSNTASYYKGFSFSHYTTRDPATMRPPCNQYEHRELFPQFEIEKVPAPNTVERQQRLDNTIINWQTLVPGADGIVPGVRDQVEYGEAYEENAYLAAVRCSERWADIGPPGVPPTPPNTPFHGGTPRA